MERTPKCGVGTPRGRGGPTPCLGAFTSMCLGSGTRQNKRPTRRLPILAKWAQRQWESLPKRP